MATASRRPTLAYVSPLPPQRSGISDYSAELLPELARHYDIDVIVAQETISDPWIRANCSVRDVGWFATHAHRFERVLYQFGNSEFHGHMFDLLERFGGAVVLHDFFLSGVVAFADARGWIPNGWARELYHAHGYASLQERFHASDGGDVVLKYPCNLSVIEQAKGVIVHSEFSRRLADAWYGSGWGNDWALIPLLRAPAVGRDRAAARRTLALGEDAFAVCSFGAVGSPKQNRRLLDAFCASELANDERCVLVFVGENLGGDYGDRLFDAIRASGLADRIRVTGWMDSAQFRNYLAAADLAVQLRTSSRGETSAAVLDCMNQGLPTIVNANGSMSELPDDSVCMLPDAFGDEQLTRAMQDLWRDPPRRRALGAKAREVIRAEHAPRACADRYAEAIEKFYESSRGDRHGLARAICDLKNAPAEKAPWLALAQSMAQCIPPRRPRRQLLLDASALVQRECEDDAGQTLRGTLKRLLLNPPAGFTVEPIYAAAWPGYRYARRFNLQLLDCPNQALADEPVEVYRGDILVGLNGPPPFPAQWAEWCSHLRRIGAKVYCLECDVMSGRQAERSTVGAGDEIESRLRSICLSHAADSIVRSATDERPPAKNETARGIAAAMARS